MNTKLPEHPGCDARFNRWLELADKGVAGELTDNEHNEFTTLDANLFPQFENAPSWRQHYKEANKPTAHHNFWLNVMVDICLWIIAVGALSSPLWLHPLLETLGK